jgi:hypothetical protein
MYIDLLAQKGLEEGGLLSHPLRDARQVSRDQTKEVKVNCSCSVPSYRGGGEATYREWQRLRGR